MDTGNVNRSHRAQRGGATPHQTAGTGGTGRRGSVAASQGGAAAHIASRAQGAGPSAGPSAQGRQPRASLPAQARNSPPRMTDTAAGTVIDKAVEFFRQREASPANPELSSEQAVRAKLVMLELVQRGLDAIPYLNIFQLRSERGQQKVRVLLQKQAELACQLAGSVIKELEGQNASDRLMLRMQVAQMMQMSLMPDFERELDEHLEHLDGALEKLEPWMDAVSASIKALGEMPYLKTEPSVAQSVENAVVGLTGMRLKRIEKHLNGIELCIQRLDMEPGLGGTPAGIALGELKAGTASHVELLMALDILLDARVPANPEKVAQLQGQLNTLLGAARAFVEVAGEQLASDADGPPTAAVRVAQHILHFVARIAGEMEDALGAYKLPPSAARHVQGLTCLHQSIDLVAAPHHPDDSVDLAEQAESVPDAPTPAAPQQQKPQAKAKAKAKFRKQKVQESGGAPSTAQAPAHSALLDLAKARLRGFERPPQDRVVSLADLIAVGGGLGKNTSVLEAYRHEGSDPLEAGNQMRLSLDSWFGNAGRWEAMQGQLQALQGADGKGPADGLLRTFGEERIQPLRQLHAQVDALELDRVKTFPYPRLKHVAHLMKADAQGQSLKVGAPSRLRSHSDPDGHRGTVFEVKLGTGKLANGQPAPPLYVHLHTKEPVTAEACRTIAFEDLDAVHVKNAAQRKKGRTWEVLNNALDSVHRGPLDAEALKLLQQRMAPG